MSNTATGSQCQLESVFERLKNGEEIVLETYPNTQGKEIPSEVLYMENGNFEVREIVCTQSRVFGLGDCKCEDHRTCTSYKVTKRMAMRKIRTLLYKQGSSEAYEKAQLAWLDDLITDLKTYKEIMRIVTGKQIGRAHV